MSMVGDTVVKRSSKAPASLQESPSQQPGMTMLHKAGISSIVCELISMRHPDGRNNACIVAKPDTGSW